MIFIDKIDTILYPETFYKYWIFLAFLMFLFFKLKKFSMPFTFNEKRAEAFYTLLQPLTASRMNLI